MRKKENIYKPYLVKSNSTDIGLLAKLYIKFLTIVLYQHTWSPVRRHPTFGGQQTTVLFVNSFYVVSGERLSPYVAVCCIAMGLSVLFW